MTTEELIGKDSREPWIGEADRFLIEQQKELKTTQSELEESVDCLEGWV